MKQRTVSKFLKISIKPSQVVKYVKWHIVQSNNYNMTDDKDI